ncbi:hypothetical protein NM688_g2465 [Phlebia brevispora]|uniref:Uncharacterized protein n=1 Tax=Phlebia brevispora TaxID=194682 RepID=A0ACC1T8R5_9APHY|nr:hypothetical protein NM688_g2465 [Phlebia brevispora]
MSLAYYIVNNEFLRVADVFEAEVGPGISIIGQHKGLPETFNQQWHINVTSFTLSTSIYTASIQALQPASFAVPQGAGVFTGNTVFDWALQAVVAPFGGAASYRIGQTAEGPFWTAQTNDTENLLPLDNGEDQLWTFVQVVQPGTPL